MITQSIEGITEYDAFGKPTKYFLEYSEIYLGNESVIEELRKKVIAEYERDKQEAERKQAREKAQYLQDLENIRQHELKGKGKMEYFSITPQYLDEFWGIGSTPNCKLDVQGFVKATNFQKLRGDLSQIDGLLYFGAGSYDKLRFWFLKKAVYESYLEFIPSKLQVNYENDTPEEMKLKVDYIQNIEGIAEFREQLQSEVEEVARNLSESLLIFEMGDEQQVLLFDVIRNMLYFRNHEPFQKLFTYAVLLFTQLEQIDKFSVQNPPPSMEALLTANKQTMVQVNQDANEQNKAGKINLDVDDITAAFIFKLLRLYSNSAIKHNNLHQIFQIRGEDITLDRVKYLQTKKLSKVKREALEAKLEIDFNNLHQEFLQAFTESNQAIFSELQNIFKDVQQGFYKGKR